MHNQHLSHYQHHHTFSSPDLHAEKMTKLVVYLTLSMMIVEIVAGYAYHSMALLADGWHMSTHAVALAIALLAFVIARRHADDRRYAFGTWKIEVLGGFTSGLILGAVGLAMSYVSIERLVNPVPIQYDQAILITALGLGVNFLSAFMLKGRHHAHHYSHHDETAHSHKEHSHEKSANLNLKAAYLHVIADAATSVFAIIALVGAKYLNWVWLDPLMGIAGAALILRWTYGLLKETGTILVDRENSGVLAEQIKQIIEDDGETKISDLHLWKVGMNKFACIVSLVTSHPQDIAFYKQKLGRIEELVHLTVEINICTHP